jgi:hypothetical protein
MNLEFVTAEEAAKWPEGCKVLLAYRDSDGPKYKGDDYWRPDWADIYAGKFTHFARLPETLPELEKPA